MEESSPLLKYVPGIKTKILSIMIPIVIVVGAAMVALDYLDVANAKEQNALKAGALLLVYAVFSFRGLNRYRIFFDLYPEKFTWRQGFRPFSKNLSIKYGQIDRIEVGSLTSTLIIELKPEAGKPAVKLRLAPSIRKIEGTLAKPEVENLEKEVGTNNQQVREIIYLKYELLKRIANQSAITKTAY